MEIILPDGHEKPLAVMVGVCVHRAIDPDTTKGLFSLLMCPNPLMGLAMNSGEAHIGRSRSIVASRFVENKTWDILFFIDDDIIFNPNDVVRICKAMKNNKMDICGGAYAKKSVHNPFPQIKTFDGQSVIFGDKGTFYEVDKVATGFVGIHRRVFEGMVADGLPLCHPDDMKYYPFFMDDRKEVNGKMIILGEDWSFMESARKLGYRVWLDSTVKLAHAGRYLYTMDDVFRPQRVDIKNWEYCEKEGHPSGTVLDVPEVTTA